MAYYLSGVQFESGVLIERIQYNEYMPKIPIVFDNRQVLLNLWILHELSDEDLVLSKAAMFNL